MSAVSLVQSILIGILAVFGWTLIARTPPSGAEAARAATLSNSQLVFQRARGVGARGERIDSESARKPRRVVAFLLRGSSLGADLVFWRGVASALPDLSGIELVGYCDGNECVDALKTGAPDLGFSVIAYGEVVAAQAVVNADVRRAFVVAGDPLPDSSAARWRDTGQRPTDIAARLLK